MEGKVVQEKRETSSKEAEALDADVTSSFQHTVFQVYFMNISSMLMFIIKNPGKVLFNIFVITDYSHVVTREIRIQYENDFRYSFILCLLCKGFFFFFNSGSIGRLG